MNIFIEILIVLLIVGLIIGLINYTPDNVIPPFIKRLIWIVAVVFAILWLANMLFHFAPRIQ